MNILSKNRYGCGTAKRKGTCSNLSTMAASEIEHLVLDGLQNRLLQSDMTKIFIKEYFSELENIRTRYRDKVRSLAKEKGKLESQIKRLVEAIADGTVKNIGAVGQKLSELERKLATLPNVNKTEPREIDLQQQATELYRSQIQNLAKTLNEEDTVREEGSNALRQLIDRVCAMPRSSTTGFDLVLHGKLANAISMAKNDNTGGGRGIRTLDTVDRIHAFQACAFSHSATPPVVGNYIIITNN